MRGRQDVLRASLTLVLLLAACSSPPQPEQRSPTASPTAAPPSAPLAAVSPLPLPALPAWIDAISPTGTAQPGSQIRIRFRHDLIALESLEAPDHQSLLSHFAIEPALGGHFVVLTPRMVEFEADAPLPPATRISVTLTNGLRDLQGETLATDLSWTFETPALNVWTNLSDDDSQVTQEPTLAPQIVITSNTEIDLSSLEQRAQLTDGNNTKIALQRVAAPAASPTPPSEAPGEDLIPTFSYTFAPAHALRKAANYTLTIKGGVLPLRGNLPSRARVLGYLHTYGPLTLDDVVPFGLPDADGADGRFAGGTPSLTFDNGLNAASAARSIVLEPSPAPNVTLVAIQDGDTSVVLNPDALRPNTHYAITVRPDLTDVFGQTLGTAQRRTFTTGPLAGDLWAPTGLNIFPASRDLALNVTATNLLDGAYRLGTHRLQPEELIFTDPGADQSTTALLGSADTWRPFPAPRLNRSVTTQLALRELLGAPTGMLVYGVSAKTNHYVDGNGNPQVAQPTFMGAVQLTNIGVFAQWFPDSGIVRAHRLSDGTPIAGAQIAIYPSELDTGKQTYTPPCATGVTDASGTLALGAVAFAPCAVVSTTAQSAPSLLVVARSGRDWTFVRTNEWSGSFEYDIYSGWSAGVPNSHGTIVSDRDLYQPGETAYFTGIGYFETDGILTRGRASSYELTLESPSGAKTDLGSTTLDPFGAFTLTLPLSKGQELGYYQLHAHAENGESIDGGFRVAEFKPPNFKVSLALDRQYATPGQQVSATWQSAYLFGAPVQGGNAHLYVTRSRAYVTPTGWDTYWFGRSWSYPEQEPSVPGDVLQADSTIPADGKSAQTITVGDDLPYPMTYEVDAQTTDVSNLSVTDSKTFTAFPSDNLIGLESDFVATAGQPHALNVIVTDPDGKPRTGQHVHLTLQLRSYGSATQLVEGSETPADSVHYTDVGAADVISAQKPQSVSLTPSKPGDYRIRANFFGAQSDATATDVDLWVGGPGAFSWAPSPGNVLSVKLDKTKYRPGQIARVLVQSPYPRAELYLAVVRHGVLFKKTELVQGAAPQTSFTVTPEMLPNAAVEVVLVRRGAPLERVVPSGLTSLASIGLTPFDVAIDAKYLKLAIIPERAHIEPQQTQRVLLHVTDAAGHGVRTELALAVVNEAILQLGGYRFPDLAQIVYADQPISTRFADSRENVTLTSPASAEKGFGYGGGLEPGAAGTRVRTQFKPIAFYDGKIRTNDAGDALVSFKVPDNLTTWRIMAMAFSADARFATADTAFIASKALVTNAVLPQFARPGDLLRGGVAVINAARKQSQVSIQGTLGGDLVFVNGDQTSTTTALQAPIDQLTQAFRFDMRVTGPKTGSVQFATSLDRLRDAFREPLDILTSDVTESVVTVGTTTTQTAVPLQVDPTAPTAVGGVEITLASTLLPQVQEPLGRALADQTPLATAIASRITVIADAILLDRLYERTPEIPALQAALGKNLEALRALRHSDGGYAQWPGAPTSEIYSTAFCAVSLTRARAAGAQVGADLDGVRSFLLSRLANPKPDGGESEPEVSEVRLEALETLGTMGELRDDHLSDIVAQHMNFSYYEQVELARHLLRLPAWYRQGIALRNALFQQVWLTGRSAVVNIPGSSVETATDGQSQIVSLLLESHTNPEDVDRAMRGLLDLRHNGLWPCPCDDAEALDALVAYANLQPVPPDFRASAEMPGAHLTAHFRGFGQTQVKQQIPAAKLTAGKSTIILRTSDRGTLHYVIVYRYGLQGAQPGVYAGIRLERILRAANDPHELARFGLGEPAAALTLDAAHVYEIEDRITTDHPINDVLLTDPLPAGFEAVDTSFRTATHAFAPGQDNWQIDYQQIYRDHILAFAQHLEAGVYSVHYLVRSVTPGTFSWPPAEVHPQYAPEDFGRTAAGSLTIH